MNLVDRIVLLVGPGHFRRSGAGLCFHPDGHRRAGWQLPPRERRRLAVEYLVAWALFILSWAEWVDARLGLRAVGLAGCFGVLLYGWNRWSGRRLRLGGATSVEGRPFSPAELRRVVVDSVVLLVLALVVVVATARADL